MIVLRPCLQLALRVRSGILVKQKQTRNWSGTNDVGLDTALTSGRPEVTLLTVSNAGV